MPRLSLRLVLVLLLAGALAPASDPIPETPWPHGDPPSALELLSQVEGAGSLADLELFEEFLAAAEKGEDSENLPIFQADIDNGLYDKETLFRFGDELFSHEYTLDNGYGDGTSTYKNLRRVHTGARGGLDTFSCAGCHSVGGPDGAGSQTQNAFLAGDGDRASSANIRNAPALLGLGLVQGLADEMTYDLKTQRQQALDQAKQANTPVTVALKSKGVSFGAIIVYPDAAIDYKNLAGVDFDMTVKPFGWKGTATRLRRFVEDAARIHFGIQSHVLALGYKNQPDVPHLGPGPDWYDPDNDGHQRELEEGLITATAVYLAMLETPVVLPPHDPGLRERWASGSALFDKIGCADCHRRTLTLLSTYWHETADTTGGEVILNLLRDGDPPRGTALVEVFSDLKRHEMGPKLSDPHDNEQGLSRSAFLTRPLWGLAETPPYLHDGRAPTIPAAILAHGGEGQAARDAFAALSPEDQANVHIFLLSLTREPKVRVAR